MKCRSMILILAMSLLAGCNESEILSLDGEKEVNMRELRRKALHVIGEGLIHENGIMRVNSIEIVVTGELREFLPLVRKLLDDDAPAVRFAATVAIGDMMDRSSVYAAKRLLRDEDKNVQMAAAYALARLDDPAAANLIRQYLQDEDETVQANAALLLGKLGDSRDISLVRRVLHSRSSSDRAKIQALESLARLKYKPIYERLWSLLISKHPDDKVMGIRAMGQLGTKEARDAVVTMLDDELWEVRLCAAEELGRLGKPVGEPEVLQYLETESQGPNENSLANALATMAIGQIATPRLQKYLPNRLDSQAEPIRLRAARSVILVTR